MSNFLLNFSQILWIFPPQAKVLSKQSLSSAVLKMNCGKDYGEDQVAYI